MSSVKFWQKHDRLPEIELVSGDITKMSVDAIVTGVQPNFVLSGGLDNAIHQAAGPELRAACTGIGQVALGQAVITYGYALPCKYVIHAAVSPFHTTGLDPLVVLAMAYTSVLTLADQYQISTLGLPSLATGIFGIPHDKAGPVVAKSLRDYFLDPVHINTNLCHVQLILFHEENISLYQSFFVTYFV